MGMERCYNCEGLEESDSEGFYAETDPFEFICSFCKESLQEELIQFLGVEDAQAYEEEQEIINFIRWRDSNNAA